MGVTFSHITTSPIFFASAIVGFVSFAFTVATWLRVFWNNINSLFAAESEIHGYLSTLRIELYEEKASLKRLRRHNRGLTHSSTGTRDRAGLRLDDATLRSLIDVLRRLTRRFKNLERPFLMENDAIGKRRPSGYPYGRESANWETEMKDTRSRGRRGSERRNRRDVDDDEDEDQYWVSSDYCDITFAKRSVCLKRRSEAMDLTESLSRVQTRRIARQVGEIAVSLHDYSVMIDDIRQDLEDLTGRLDRIVGLRRIE